MVPEGEGLMLALATARINPAEAILYLKLKTLTF